MNLFLALPSQEKATSQPPVFDVRHLCFHSMRVRLLHAEVYITPPPFSALVAATYGAALKDMQERWWVQKMGESRSHYCGLQIHDNTIRKSVDQSFNLPAGIRRWEFVDATTWQDKSGIVPGTAQQSPGRPCCTA